MNGASHCPRLARNTRESALELSQRNPSFGSSISGVFVADVPSGDELNPQSIVLLWFASQTDLFSSMESLVEHRSEN